MEHKSEISNLLYLRKYLAPHKYKLILVLIALCFTSGSILGLGKALEYLIDKGLHSGNIADLKQALLIMISTVVLLVVFSYIRSSIMNGVGELVVAKLRQDAYNYVIKLTPSYFENHKVGDIISRLNTDAILLNSIIPNLLSFSLRNFIMAIGGLYMLVVTSPKLSLYVVAVVPVAITLIILAGKYVKNFSRKAQEEVSRISSKIEESLNAIKLVQAYTREDYEIEYFGAIVDSALQASISRIKARSLLFATVILTVATSVCLVLWIGGTDVITGQMRAGELSSFIFYAILVASSIGGISEVMGDLQRAAAAAERVFELFNIRPSIYNIRNPKSLNNQLVEAIKFDDVSFNYPSRKEVNIIKNFSFTINRGEKIAIVGRSGAGKTTLFQLLLRFYDPNSGNIYINDLNIKDLTTFELRNLFSIVPQEPTIFSSSIYENIRYGRLSATANEIYDAARAASIFDFIEGLPDKFDSFVGEKGVQLSGGQRQRIAIARSILRNAQILLLDEATSNLDNENEKLVQDALENLMRDQTTIIIAHRISTIRNADKIIVMDNGEIQEVGTHDELIENSDIYQRLNYE